MKKTYLSLQAVKTQSKFSLPLIWKPKHPEMTPINAVIKNGISFADFMIKDYQKKKLLKFTDLLTG